MRAGLAQGVCGLRSRTCQRRDDEGVHTLNRLFAGSEIGCAGKRNEPESTLVSNFGDSSLSVGCQTHQENCLLHPRGVSSVRVYETVS